MDDVTAILGNLESVIRDEQVFQDAHIYQRGEELSDLPIEDMNAPSVFLKALDPVLPESNFLLDFRSYPVQATVVFEGRNDETLKDEEDGRDSIQNKTFLYMIALMDLLKKYKVDLGSSTFKVDARDPKLTVPVSEEQKKKDEASGQHIHRVQLTYLFQTVQPY